MLTIRPDQLSVLQQYVDQSFLKRLSRHLRDHHPAAVQDLDASQLNRGVAYAIDRARSCGLTAENAIATFSVLMFEIGPDFYKHPAIRRVLDDPLMGPNDRMMALPLLLALDNWEEAERSAAPDAWGRILSAT
jgi:hypothetical protein